MSGLSVLALGSPVSYLIAILVPALDALLPVLPSESIVIALGVATAGSADPRIAVLVVLAAAGAFLGDNLAYVLGRRFGPRLDRRVFAGGRGARQRAWAEHALDRWGGRIIIGCRFVPGGRTAVTLTCGLTGYPRRKFMQMTALAAVAWAGYAFGIGRLGGQAFEDRPWAALLLALGIALLISALIEVARRAWHWRTSARRRSWAGGRPATATGSRRTG
jgi:membrane-associated protein